LFELRGNIWEEWCEDLAAVVASTPKVALQLLQRWILDVRRGEVLDM
jgi:hypothetical protein